MFLFLYTFNSDFRNAFNSLVYSIYYAFDNGLSLFIDTVKDAIQDSRRGKRYGGTEDHHIVARTDRRAEWSRKVLSRNKISVYSSYNIVTVDKTLHKHLHTSMYHAAVFTFLRSCEISGRKNKRNSVIAGLAVISMILRTASLAV